VYPRRWSWLFHLFFFLILFLCPTSRVGGSGTLQTICVWLKSLCGLPESISFFSVVWILLPSRELVVFCLISTDKWGFWAERPGWVLMWRKQQQQFVPSPQTHARPFPVVSGRMGDVVAVSRHVVIGFGMNGGCYRSRTSAGGKPVSLSSYSIAPRRRSPVARNLPSPVSCPHQSWFLVAPPDTPPIPFRWRSLESHASACRTLTRSVRASCMCSNMTKRWVLTYSPLLALPCHNDGRQLGETKAARKQVSVKTWKGNIQVGGQFGVGWWCAVVVLLRHAAKKFPKKFLLVTSTSRLISPFLVSASAPEGQAQLADQQSRWKRRTISSQTHLPRPRTLWINAPPVNGWWSSNRCKSFLPFPGGRSGVLPKGGAGVRAGKEGDFAQPQAVGGPEERHRAHRRGSRSVDVAGARVQEPPHPCTFGLRGGDGCDGFRRLCGGWYCTTESLPPKLRRNPLWPFVRCPDRQGRDAFFSVLYTPTVVLRLASRLLL